MGLWKFFADKWWPPLVPFVTVADITTLEVDAIVNAANSDLEPGGGVCGAIYRAAGVELAECTQKLHSYPGGAIITPGFLLPAKHVIHAVGPVFKGDGRDVAVLQACYQNTLEMAHHWNLMSVAFPCISTGIYAFPFETAAISAFHVITRWLKKEIMPIDITFCCFSSEEAEVYERLLAIGE